MNGTGCATRKTMIRVDIHETIHRPIHEVFDRIADINAYPDWLPARGIFITTYQDSPGPVRAGTTYTDKTRLGTVYGDVVEFDPPHRIVFHYAARRLGFTIMEGWPGYTLEAQDETTTRVSHHGRARLGGPLNLLRSIFQRMADHERQRTVSALKDSLES